MSERDGIKCMKCARVDCSGDCRQQESEGVECYCTEDYKCHHHFRPESEGVVVEVCGPGEAMAACIPLRYPLLAPANLKGRYRLTPIEREE